MAGLPHFSRKHLHGFNSHFIFAIRLQNRRFFCFSGERRQARVTPILQATLVHTLLAARCSSS